MRSRHAFAIPLAIPLALALALPLAEGCRRSSAETQHDNAKPEAAAPIAVKLVAAQELKVPRRLTLSGSLIGSQEAKVAAGAAGKVVSTHVERGDVVKKGAILAHLDARAVGAQAQEAAAQVESVRAEAAQAKLDCQRTDQMFAKGAISKADYDKSRTQCETTKWSVSAAEARKSLTAEALSDTEIRAPFSGMVVERFVTTGEYVHVDSPVVELVDVDALRVELTVPEADVPLVRQGMPVTFRTAANDPKGAAYNGKVRYVGPSVRAQTRDAVVEAAVDNPGHDLRPGMFVTAELALGMQALPAVPTSAVRVDGAQHHVFTVEGAQLADHIVQVEDTQGGLVPIVNGIKVGDKVVVDVTPDMRDGALVE